MGMKKTGWKTKGMNRDLSVSAFNPEFAFENMNLRLSTNDKNTLLSWVNERGTLPIALSAPIVGTPLGTAILNHQLVLFTHDSTDNTKPDYIYKLFYANDEKTSMSVEQLYRGNLKFNTKNPIETLASYEAENIQKIYWTDGENQPRLINIYKNYGVQPDGTTFNPFDFVPELKLNERVTVSKKLGASGMFAPGVIQYIFTYYMKYGQETNIFYVTPLCYISHKDRGAAPDEKVDNAFEITVRDLDENYEYLRIYSLQRTSINGVPIAKRIQDIKISDLDHNQQGMKIARYVDTGTTGDIVDPTELLYKGGEVISAKTFEQKDNTIFLGNLKIKRPLIPNEITGIEIETNIARKFKPVESSMGAYKYYNQLSSIAIDTDDAGYYVPCGGFKWGETYRFGIQFQHKSGKWSDPVWVKDEPIVAHPSVDSDGYIHIPIAKLTIPKTVGTLLRKAEYKKVRPLVVFPEGKDRTVLCQGVGCPTLYTDRQRNADYDVYTQSSWFFRPKGEDTAGQTSDQGSVFPTSMNSLQYVNKATTDGMFEFNYDRIRQVEIQGNYAQKDKFLIDWGTMTFHTPDITFSTELYTTDLQNVKKRLVGNVEFLNTFSDIEVQTETPTISSNGNGFIHKSFVGDSSFGIVSGLFYEDYFVDDDGDKLEKYSDERSPVKWLVYLWNRSGSLNNDINRPADAGIASSILKKKIISNLRYTDTTLTAQGSPVQVSAKLFSSNQLEVINLGTNNNRPKIYQGNVDTVLSQNYSDGTYFVFNDDNHNENVPDKAHIRQADIVTDFMCNKWWKTWTSKENDSNAHGVYRFWNNIDLVKDDSCIGGDYLELVRRKDPVRMKYKSTPHIVLDGVSGDVDANTLPVFELVNNNVQNRFGGTTPDALRANIWVPCGHPVKISTNSSTSVECQFGDTYYQRYDCLKTYPYTHEDVNQVVEIGSFMLETHINIDGRYDKNRGQVNNLYMDPTNFNLCNEVYSQIDNFFSYRIMDEETYDNLNFPNRITWPLVKESGNDVDKWTNITLADMLELDGDKGELNKLVRFNGQIIALQDTGVSQVLYNENAMITTDAGVPVEIANSNKVSGSKYISNTVGCSDKWSVQVTPMGVYFMDSMEKSIYIFNGQLANLSVQAGMNSWTKQNIPSVEKQWTPDRFENFVSYYDKLNQDLLFINKDTALAFSERLGAFTSFYDYGNIPYFCNLDDTGIWVDAGGSIWKHQAGEYCHFFGVNKPYWMTLVGNPEPQTDKIFTNLEFRACNEGEGEWHSEQEHLDWSLPFNYLETWNEYQHGLANLSVKNGHGPMKHHIPDKSAHLDRKFRIWRCDIPRDNFAAPENDVERGITRFKAHPVDRMRNPWLYLKLQKNAATTGFLTRAEIHDLIMTYYN